MVGLPVIDAFLDWLDAVIARFVRRVSARTVAIVSLAFYPCFGLLLPLAADVDRSWFVTINLVGVGGAAAISVGWLFAQIELKDRRHLLEWTTDIRHLSAEEFEWLVGELFRREGWTVTETGSQDRGDGNVDLILTKGDERRLVQCKRWTSVPVGINEIRAFAGTLRRENASSGVFVTFSRFNEHAQREADAARVELMDGRELYHRIERVRRPEPCPTCDRPMILDRSQHGWWFRCIADNCAGKRNLDREPALAVELLTRPPAAAAIRSGQ